MLGKSCRKSLNFVLVKPSGPDCNMRCTYCFYLEKSELFSSTKVHRMSEEVLEAMVKQMMMFGEPQVSFGWQGGEPTLMGLEFFEKAIYYQEQYGMGRVVGNGLQTNGILIDEKWAKFLKKYNFLVGLSLDGPEHVHDRYRFLRNGKGSWRKVVDKAKLLLDNGVAVNALTVVNDYSADFPEEIYNFHKSLGLNFMQFIPCVEPDPLRDGRAAPFSVSAEKYGRFLCKVFDLWYADIRDGVATTSVRFFDSVFHVYVGLTPPDCTLLDECGVYVVVEHNGDVYSCDFFVKPEWKLGNVLEGNLYSMLNSEKQFIFGALKASLPDVCKSCKWLKYCKGGCTKDRIRVAEDRGVSHFCKSYKMFFEHAHDRLVMLAEKWKRQQIYAEGGGVYKKVGRNDPCPCGSGKKYKHCCGRK